MKVILTEKQLRIINLFKENLFKDYTIKEISKILKTSYTWTFNIIKEFKKQDLITLTKKGKSNLCSINLNNNLSILYLSLLEETHSYTKKLPWKNINDLLSLIDTPYFTFIITGSYAEGKQTSKSDLDIVILVDENVNIKHIETHLLSKGELMIPEVHLYIFTKSQFIKMLINNEANYGKLIFKKHLILFGTSNYYLILKEAIKNGFRGN